MLSEEQKNKIKEALIKKVPNLSCPMCKHNNFAMTQGYIVHTLQSNYSSVTLGGEAIPSIGIICNNCGFISQHAIGSLGLLVNPEKTSSDDTK
jgi:hypothetical protein